MCGGGFLWVWQVHIQKVWYIVDRYQREATPNNTQTIPAEGSKALGHRHM